jgi:hypothetical protein
VDARGVSGLNCQLIVAVRKMLNCGLCVSTRSNVYLNSPKTSHYLFLPLTFDAILIPGRERKI